MSVRASDPEPGEAGSLRDNALMVLTVIMVSALAAALLGFVHTRTREPIERSRRQELVQALGLVLPAHDNRPESTARPVAGAGSACALRRFTATRDGRVSGYALQTCTTQGFGPMIHLLVGATPEGQITGVYILAHQETPGLGAKITEDQERFPRWREECAQQDCSGRRPFLRQFALRRAEACRFQVRKDGGEIDAITASTISSRAVAEAVGASVAVLQREAQAAPGDPR